jgi:ABC-type amino acid transport substrate-binding protein
LVDGRGDIVAAYLTITPEREQLVDFSDPLLTDVRQIAVTAPRTPPLSSVDDLAGKTIFVRKSSSYWTSLEALNRGFCDQGLPPVRLKPAPEDLEDEDSLEMLNAGLVRILIVDSQVAQFWKQLFPAIQLHPNVAVLSGGDIACACSGPI